jgi:prepilin-type N-terminal cleavage/methylation domain-containing protein/prepilin-type processing-associated H-X9-DG protein
MILHSCLPRRRGFTLVELLVVIGIIALLISILLPSLNKARQSANAVKCATNLRAIGQGFALYAAEHKQRLPAAYDYRGTAFNGAGGTQVPTSSTIGYVHWSSYLYGNGVKGTGVSAKSFECPNMNEGGLVPTNPAPGGWAPGQIADLSPGTFVGADGKDYSEFKQTAQAGDGVSGDYVPDSQAPRMAYTVNEALLGRNKFRLASNKRDYNTSISAGGIRGSAGVILATEFIDNANLVSSNSNSATSNLVIKSHRPVGGWRAATGAGDGSLDLQKVDTTINLRKTTWADVDKEPLKHFVDGTLTKDTTMTRLDWVGSNHGNSRNYRENKTNFLYLDGHVETKTLKETIDSWEWGEKMYSLKQQN